MEGQHLVNGSLMTKYVGKSVRIWLNVGVHNSVGGRQVRNLLKIVKFLISVIFLHSISSKARLQTRNPWKLISQRHWTSRWMDGLKLPELLSRTVQSTVAKYEQAADKLEIIIIACSPETDHCVPERWEHWATRWTGPQRYYSHHGQHAIVLRSLLRSLRRILRNGIRRFIVRLKIWINYKHFMWNYRCA